MDINKRTSELLINKMLNAQNPNSKSSDFASKMDQRGVEPLSESNLTGLSPGAVCYLHSLGAAGADTLRALVAS